MEESLIHDIRAVSIIDSENTEGVGDDEESDRWSELSSGPVDKNWTVVDGKDEDDDF